MMKIIMQPWYYLLNRQISSSKRTNLLMKMRSFQKVRTSLKIWVRVLGKSPLMTMTLSITPQIFWVKEDRTELDQLNTIWGSKVKSFMKLIWRTNFKTSKMSICTSSLKKERKCWFKPPEPSQGRGSFLMRPWSALPWASKTRWSRWMLKKNSWYSSQISTISMILIEMVLPELPLARKSQPPWSQQTLSEKGLKKSTSLWRYLPAGWDWMSRSLSFSSM